MLDSPGEVEWARGEGLGGGGGRWLRREAFGRTRWKGAEARERVNNSGKPDFHWLRIDV